MAEEKQSKVVDPCLCLLGQREKDEGHQVLVSANEGVYPFSCLFNSLKPISGCSVPVRVVQGLYVQTKPICGLVNSCRPIRSHLVLALWMLSKCNLREMAARFYILHASVVQTVR